jgi:integrase
MIGDHHGRAAGTATLLLTALDGIFGTHRPKPRLVPLINGADRGLRWFIQDVWGLFGADHTRPGAPLFPSERKCLDGSCSRATADVFRRSLAEAAARHLPAWAGKLTPHVLRHFCASQLYLAGMSLFAIQELLGHYVGDRRSPSPFGPHNA